MAEGWRFVPNPLAPSLLVRGPLMQHAMDSIAEHVAEGAKAVAPVLTGAYRDSIHVEDGPAPGQSNVVADVPYAVYVEFGTSDTPTFAPLRRGLDGANG